MTASSSIALLLDGEVTRENVAVLDMELATAGHELVVGPVAMGAFVTFCRSDHPRAIAAVERQSASALRAGR